MTVWNRVAVSLSAVSVVAAGSGPSRAGQGRKIRKYDLHSVDRLEELRHDVNEIVEVLCQGSWQGAAGQPRATCRGQGRDFSPSVLSESRSWGQGHGHCHTPAPPPVSLLGQPSRRSGSGRSSAGRWPQEGQGWVRRVRLGCGEIGRSQ